MIIHLLRKDCNRYSLLQKAIPDISKQTLTNQLRELETDGVINRIIYPEIPPKVVYTMTPYGNSLLPVIELMESWGLEHMEDEKKCEA